MEKKLFIQILYNTRILFQLCFMEYFNVLFLFYDFNKAKILNKQYIIIIIKTLQWHNNKEILVE